MNSKIIVTVFVFLVASVLCFSDDKIEQPTQKSTVSLDVKNKDIQMRHPIVRIKINQGAGSGTIVYSEDREVKGEFKTFIITNYHVINSAIRIEKKWNSLKQKFEDIEVLDRVGVDIFRYDKNGAEDGAVRYDGEIICYDSDEDIALVQLVTTVKIENTAKMLTLEDEKPRVFEKVFAVGCSLAQSPIPSEGLLTNVAIVMERKKFWMVSSPIIFGNCLQGNSMVTTEYGPKLIKDIQAGEIVWTVNEETMELQKNKVLENICSGKKLLYEIKTNNRKLIASGNHPVLAGTLVGKEKIRNKNIWKLEWKTVDELKEGDAVVCLRKLPEENIIEETLFNTENKCKFLGAYIGDGYLRIRPKIGNSVHLCLFNNIFEQAYKVLIEKEFNIKTTITSGVLNCYNSDFATKLAYFGLQKKALQKKLPDFVWKLPFSYKKEILNGYYETDGWLNQNPKTGFKTYRFEANNEFLISQMRDLAISCGLQVDNIHTRMRKNITINGVKTKANAKSASFGTTLEQHYIKSLMNINGLPKLNDNLIWQRVSKKSVYGEELTYDLHIENNHNFIADGFIVHNSGGALFIERDGNYYWAGVPCAVAATQQQVVGHMAYVIPLDRIHTWINSQKLIFLIDKTKTPGECLKEREKAKENK